MPTSRSKWGQVAVRVEPEAVYRIDIRGSQGGVLAELGESVRQMAAVLSDGHLKAQDTARVAVPNPEAVRVYARSRLLDACTTDHERNVVERVLGRIDDWRNAPTREDHGG